MARSWQRGHKAEAQPVYTGSWGPMGTLDVTHSEMETLIVYPNFCPSMLIPLTAERGQSRQGYVGRITQERRHWSQSHAGDQNHWADLEPRQRSGQKALCTF